MKFSAPLLLVLLAGAVPVVAGTTANPPTAAEPRGGRVGWARIITSSAAWNRHAQSDPMLMQFIRTQTNLNIDPTWYAADPASLEQLCAYPLLYTNNLTDVEPEKRKNLQEYLNRGGFIVVDACIDPRITPDPDAFLRQHLALLKTLVPDSEVRELPASHEIYRQYFPMKDTPPHMFMNDVYDQRWAKHGLYGVFVGSRLVSLLTLSGLQCSWSSHPERAHATECMKMLVNIYVYRMTH